MSTPVIVPSEFEALAEKIGDFVAYWGFKRIHGRVWAHLFTSKDPLDATSLIHRLKISKALVSLTLKDLLHYQVVFEVGKSERGTTLYRANPKVVEVIINVLRRREKLLLEQIQAAHEKVQSLPQDQSSGLCLCDDRVRMLGTLIGEAGACLDDVIGLQDLSLEPWRAFATSTRSASQQI